MEIKAWSNNGQGRKKIYFLIKAALKVKFFQGIFNLLISAVKTVKISAKNVSQPEGTDFIKKIRLQEVLAYCYALIYFGVFLFEIQDNR